MDLVRTTGEFVMKHGLVLRGQRVAVAFSGGPDSTALLHVMKRLSRAMGFDIAALHVNHGMRGSRSDGDQEFCVKTAEGLGVPSFVEKLGSGRLPASNVEEELRDRRHAVFCDYLLRGFHCVALGHTRDDRAETLLMRLLRGSGLEGLAAMPGSSGGIVRPLLETGKEDVLRFLEGEGIPFRWDESNDDPRFFRNRLRKLVFPILGEVGHGDARRSLARAAGLLHEEHVAYRLLLSEKCREIFMSGDARTSLDLGRFRALPPALRAPVMREWIRTARGDLRGLTLLHFRQAVGLAMSDGGVRRLSLPGRLSLARSLGSLEWAFGEQAPGGFEYRLMSPGAVHVPETGEEFTLSAHAPPPEAGVESVGVAQLPVTIRSFRPGDRVRLPCGTKKIKKLFLEKRVPAFLRNRVALVFDGCERVVWIPSLDIRICYNAPCASVQLSHARSRDGTTT